MFQINQDKPIHFVLLEGTFLHFTQMKIQNERTCCENVWYVQKMTGGANRDTSARFAMLAYV